MKPAFIETTGITPYNLSLRIDQDQTGCLRIAESHTLFPVGRAAVDRDHVFPICQGRPAAHATVDEPLAQRRESPDHRNLEKSHSRPGPEVLTKPPGPELY